MTHLKEGDQAPAFTGTDQNGNTVSLANLKGKKIVLYFYPKDDTPGCTAQACNLRDNYSALQEKGIVVLGVSADDKQSHKTFSGKYDLPFPLLADTNKEIIRSYGVWGEKNLYGRKNMGLHRTTFLIDADGKIQKIWKRPNTKAHAEEILKVATK